MELSVVLPTLNGAKTIGEQLAALLHQTTSRPYEVIVVDNGSTDDLSDVVTAFQAGPVPVSLITAVPPGLNRARNAGVKFADGENILLCDCDDIVGLAWIETMAKCLAISPTTGGGLHVASINSQKTLARWGVDGTLFPADGYAFLPAPYGANCGFRREVWDAVGGFDESLTMGGDDFDFFWRAQLAGYSYMPAPDAVVQYRLRSTWRSIWRRQYRFGKANVQMYQRFRDQGLGPSSTALAAKGWAWSILMLPLAILMPTKRGAWIRTTAKRCGRLIGSLKLRHLYL